MTRWTMNLIPALLLMIPLTACGTTGSASLPASEPAEPMNVVFFLVDDYGWKDVSYNGSKFYETPNIDKLAETGMVFTDGYAACPVCSPTRAAILSGKYPARINTTDFFGAPQGSAIMKQVEEGKNTFFANRPLIPADYIPQLPLEEVTFAEALKEQGYATFFAGKWHLGHTGFEPTKQGFDINVAGHRGGGPYGGGKYFHPFPKQMPNIESKPGDHLPTRLAEETSKFITENKEGPFLAYLSFYSVHTPLLGREDLVEYYEKKRERMGLEDVFGQEPPRKVRQTQAHAVYAAMIHAMDEAVGSVMNTLEEQGLADNTLVIFTADNGGLSTSEGHPTSNLPLRAGKGWLYEGGIREPTIVRWPGLTAPGSTSSVPITSTDYYPTILAAAKADPKPKQHVDGLSLVPVLSGQADELDREAIYWHYPHYGNQGGTPGSAIRMGDWKLIKFYTPGKAVELYNLKDDLGEQNNLAEAKPEITKKLLGMLEAHLDETDARFPQPNPRKKKNNQMLNKLILAVAFAVSLSAALSSSAQTDRLPNIVILYADDMGVADVSYGNPKAKIQTPNLDRLAKQGMTFTDGHSSSGICTPSRFAMLTGQHHWRRFHGIVSAFGGPVFKDGEYTIAQMLKDKGYKTGCFGKWHLGWDWNAIRKPGVKREDWPKAESYDWTKPFPGGPLDRGFDHYFGDGTINFPPYCWIEGDRFVTIPTKPVIKSRPLAGAGSFRPGPMAEDWSPYDILPTITQKTVEWIEQQDGETPFFAYLAFNSPHYPIVPNKPFHGKSQAGYYGDFMIETDAMVGQVLTALKKKGLDDNTIVIFTADNGAEKLAFQRLHEFDHWSSGPHRGLKRDVYEGGHRVPLIVRWPGQVQAGTVSDETVSQVDFAATFASIVDYELSNEVAIDSYDILPVLKGEDYAKPLRVATVHNTFKNQYALRQGDWVLIDAPTGSAVNEPQAYLDHFGLDLYGQGHTGLLFNLKDDPRQSNNLYEKHPDKVQAMRALLKQYIEGKRCAPLR
eukprot:g12189.t1